MDHLTERIVPTLNDIYFVDASSVKQPQKDLTFGISVDEGYIFGLSFFETILVLDKAAFCDAHVNRLNNSLSQFNIPLHITTQLIDAIIRAYTIKDKALKIQVSKDNIVVSTRDITYTKDYYLKGATVTLSPIVRSSQSYLVGHKSGNYGDLILSLRKAHDLGFSDCLFLNEFGYLTETSIANLFLIKNGTLYTPDLKDGLLPGVIRAHILSTYTVMEKSLSITDLMTCDGAFLTNSLVGIVKLSRFETSPIPDHPLITSIIADYNNYIGGFHDISN